MNPAHLPMKTSRLLFLGALSALFAGCALFHAPSAKQAQNNEDRARAAAATRAADERKKLMDDLVQKQRQRP